MKLPLLQRCNLGAKTSAKRLEEGILAAQMRRLFVPVCSLMPSKR